MCRFLMCLSVSLFLSVCVSAYRENIMVVLPSINCFHVCVLLTYQNEVIQSKTDEENSVAIFLRVHVTEESDLNF